MSTTIEQSCMVLSLNCARGESSTYAVLSFVSKNPHYTIIAIQEPWLNINHEPPPVKGFDMFIPVSTYPKCVTYIRKSTQLQPTLELSESDSFLGIRLTTPNCLLTIYNFYSPGRQHAVCHLFHTFQPDANAIICGDFNSHHPMW